MGKTGEWEGNTVVYDVLMLTTISAHKVGENLHHVGKVALHLYLPTLPIESVNLKCLLSLPFYLYLSIFLSNHQVSSNFSHPIDTALAMQ